MSARTRCVSVIAPMLNEAEHVETLVADLAMQDYDGDIELLIADGGSTDGSVARLRSAADTHRLDLQLVANPARYVSPGLNECLRRATGDLIVRVDCHARYPRDYVRRCVEAAEATDAWNVGGLVEPEGRSPGERAVAAAMTSPLGGIGWTRDRNADSRVETDTVFCGAFPRRVFERVGGYDETLVRNQDDELNLRIRRAGGSIVLDPAIRARYVPRGTYTAVFRQYYGYGRWKVPVMLKHRQVASARSLAPIALVASITALAGGAPFSGRARRGLAVELASYAIAVTAAGGDAARRRREPPMLVPRICGVFPCFHFGYGIGMVVGWARALRARQTL